MNDEAKFNVFKKFVQRDVIFQYPKLDQPYRYNNAERRSEPCSAAANGAAYSISFQMPPTQAKEFHADLKQHYEACRAADKSLPKFSKIFGFKKLDTGEFQFSAKRNATTGKGVPAKPVEVMEVVNGEMTPLADKAFWSGSTGHVRVNAFPTKDPDGQGGISLALSAVVVTDVVRGGDDWGDFGMDVAAPSQSEIEDDFGTPPAKSSKPVDPDGQTEDDIDFG